ncbi:hypothetical protein K502DRAFT_368222 [Neoconidiobolus thromboides FSU 785]|nr:hypothetical protein K502DRAFT_368222 [Neoconidiobolus thromboides FSU 785]
MPQNKNNITKNSFLNAIVNTPLTSYDSPIDSPKATINIPTNSKFQSGYIPPPVTRRCSVMGTAITQTSLSHTKPSHDLQLTQTSIGSQQELEYQFQPIDYQQMDARFYTTSETILTQLVKVLQNSVEIQISYRIQSLIQDFFQYYSKEFPIIDVSQLVLLLKSKITPIKYRLLVALSACCLFCKRFKENSDSDSELKEGLELFSYARSLDDNAIKLMRDGDVAALLATFSIISYIEKRFFSVKEE